MNSKLINYKNFKSLDKEYLDDLKECALPISDEYFKYLIPDLNSISEDERTFLDMHHYIQETEYVKTQLFPFTLVLSRLFIEKAWIFFNYIEIIRNEKCYISTYEDLYYYLKNFPLSTSIKLLEQISVNSSYRNSIISAYKNADIRGFVENTEKTGEDYTIFMNKVYILSLFFSGAIYLLHVYERCNTLVNKLWDKTNEDFNEVELEYLFGCLAHKLDNTTNTLQNYKEFFKMLYYISQGKKHLIVSNKKEKIDIKLYIQNIGIKEFSIKILACYRDLTDLIFNAYEKVKKRLLFDEIEIIDNLFNKSISCRIHKGNSEYSEDSQPSKFAESHNSKNEKLFVRVLKSKIPLNRGKDENDVLVNCLSKLYDIIKNESDTDYEVSKPIFIYRFSGIGRSFPYHKRIIWNNPNVLLGHIVRCLISDKYNPPMDFVAIKSFFISESGKEINLASAGYVDVKDFEKQKDGLPKYFVEAVEILRSCGFTNVEFTSKRR